MHCEYTDTEGDHVTEEAEIGWIQLQAKEHLGLWKPRRDKEGSAPLEEVMGARPCSYLNFKLWTPELWKCMFPSF